MTRVLRRGEEAHGCSVVLGVLGRLLAGDNVRPGARVLAGDKCGGELDSLNQVCCRSAGGPGGSPAAAWMRAPRRRESPAPLYELRQLQIGLSQIGQWRTPHGVHYGCTRLFPPGAPGGVLATPPAPRRRRAPTSITRCLAMQLVFSPSAKFAQVRGRYAGAHRPRASQRCPSRRPRGAARRGSGAPPGGRGSLSLHLQVGGRRRFGCSPCIANAGRRSGGAAS